MIYNWHSKFCFDSVTIALILDKKEKTMHNIPPSKKSITPELCY